MKRKIRTALATGLLLLGMLLPGISLAQDAPMTPSSPQSPLTYDNAWTPIEPGAYHWYAFKYRTADSNRPMQIRFYTRPADGVSLMLLNGDQVRVWQQGGKLEFFGEATPAYRYVEQQVSLEELCKAQPNADECKNGDFDSNSDAVNPDDCVANSGGDRNDDNCYLLPVRDPLGFGQWAGELGASGDYYILVRRNTNSSGSGEYRFTTSGDGYTFR